MTTMSIPIISGQRPSVFDRILIRLGIALTAWGRHRAETSTRGTRRIPDPYRDTLSPDLIYYRMR